LTSVALGSPWLLSSCNNEQIVQESSQEISTHVAAILGKNLDSITRDAIDALGGIQTVHGLPEVDDAKKRVAGLKGE